MATLDNISAELIILIAQQVKLSGHRLSSLATISRQWQTQVESIVFSSLTVCASELQNYSQMLNRCRFVALRNLNYRIDNLTFANDTINISAAACCAYSEAFTQSIRHLFTMLKERYEDTTAGVLRLHPGITLRLLNHSFVGKDSLYLQAKYDSRPDSRNDDERSDSSEYSDAVPYSDGWDGVSDDDDEYDEFGPESKLTRAWLRWVGDDLPMIPIVTKFANQDNPSSRSICLFDMVRPDSWSRMISCLPNVRFVNMYAYDGERRDRAGRLKARNGKLPVGQPVSR
jgi:hypothetical protein